MMPCWRDEKNMAFVPELFLVRRVVRGLKCPLRSALENEAMKDFANYRGLAARPHNEVAVSAMRGYPVWPGHRQR